MKSIKYFTVLALCSITVLACNKQVEEPEEAYYFDAGGATTIYSSGPDAFTFPLANLDENGVNKHFISDGIFGQHFVSAANENFSGLGPVYNQNSCEGCHVRNGRGSVPQFEGDLKSGLLLRLSVPGVGDNGGVKPAPNFGGQLQNKALYGVKPEGKISKTEINKIIDFLDGFQVQLTKPVYSIAEPYTTVPSDILISPRVAPPVHGMGLLEAISTTDIFANADEQDADNDGISGKVNRVWNVLKKDFDIGRFGWKAEQPTGAQQAADAAHNDMGLTSVYFPKEHCEGQENCNEGTQDDLDVDLETINLFAFYSQTLAVPAQRDVNDPAVLRGKQLFMEANCAACHIPKFVTGQHEIKELSNQEIYPYTDLLLHDMGEGLADDRPVYSASGTEWRTAPLWGIGLTQVVNPKATFLHDGRAKTLEEAILWHGGEAQKSNDYYQSLSIEDRQAIIAFLKSL